MGILGDYTLQQLKDAGVTVIRTKFKEKLDLMTKKQLIILYLKGNDIDIENMEIQDRSSEEYWPDGQIKEWTIRTRDVLGNVISKEKVTVTYYDTKDRERDTMLFFKYDSNDKELSVRGIKHFPDGRQPKAFEGREYKE
jgi:hypothetical protein